MRHTPRNTTPRPRGFGTLIGNGWLRESDRNLFPRAWDVRGRSALRKCMFLPAPAHLREHLRESPVLPPPPRAPRELPIVAHRRDPQKDVRLMPAIDAAAMHRAARAKLAEGAKRGDRASAWEDPVALGALLVAVPPIGLAVLWSSRRYSSDARWALTLMTALTLCLVTAVVIVVALR
jgi:hypothetical protein